MNNNDKKKFSVPTISIILFVIATIFIIIGLYKILVYQNPENSWEGNLVNAYVGGDAYNFIINANYAVAYFTLALLFNVTACSFAIINTLKLNSEEQIKILSNLVENDENLEEHNDAPKL